MNSVKQLYVKVVKSQKASKEEMDQLCLNLKAVQQINISKKSQKDKVELLGRLIPDVKKSMKGKEEDVFLLNDLVRQWVIDTTKVCIAHLDNLGIKTPEQKKEYMTSILGPRYTPKKEEKNTPTPRKTSSPKISRSSTSSNASIKTVVRPSKDKRNIK